MWDLGPPPNPTPHLVALLTDTHYRTTQKPPDPTNGLTTAPHGTPSPWSAPDIFPGGL